MKTWQFNVVHRPEHWRRHDLFVALSEHVQPTADFGGRTDFAIEMIQKQVTRHGVIAPFASFDDFEELRAFLQPLVNEAARLGILPAEGASEMKAIRAHLDDMRALVFQGIPLDRRPKP